jgi:hypothetical protein
VTRKFKCKGVYITFGDIKMINVKILKLKQNISPSELVLIIPLPYHNKP